MTEPTLEEKQKYCEELDNFILETENNVKKICSYLGYDYDEITSGNFQQETYMTCPFNNGHRVPERSMEKHLQKCEWNSLGYTKDCIPLPEPAVPPDAPSAIKFDMHLQHQVLQEAKQKNPELKIENCECYLHHGNISFLHSEEKLIPQTSDRLISDFTSDERKAMYEYVIANTVAPGGIEQDIANMNKIEKTDKKVMSTPILELLAQERNLKRRRARYRGVHTNKKSHTEILKEIVEQQMEMYKEYLEEKFGITEPNIDEKINSDDTNNVKSVEQKCDESLNVKEKYESDEKSKSNNHTPERSFQHYNRDYNGKDYKHSSHHRNYNERKSSRNNDYYSSSYKKYDDRDKHHYYDRNHDRSHSRNKSYDRNSSHHRSDKRSDSHDTYRNSSRDKYRDKNDSSYRNYGKNDSHHKNNDESNSRHKNDDKNDFHHKNDDENNSRHRNDDKNDSRHRNYDKNNDYYDTYSTDSDREYQRHRSRSSERKHKKHDSRERKHHKKSKKSHKKKRSKSASDDDKKYKSSKRKHERPQVEVKVEVKEEIES